MRRSRRLTKARSSDGLEYDLAEDEGGAAPHEAVASVDVNAADMLGHPAGRIAGS
jgi:hypothetical protein